MAKTRKKKLNYRVILLIATILVVLLLAFVIYYFNSKKKEPAEYAAAAEAVIAKEPINWGKAQANLQQAIKVSEEDDKYPFPGEYYLRRSDLFIQQAKEDSSLSSAEREEKLRNGFSVLNLSLQRNPKFYAALERRVEYRWPHIHRAPKDNQPAILGFIKDMDSILGSKDHQTAERYFKRGVARWILVTLGENEHIKEAISDLKKATVLDPKEIKYWLAMAGVYERQKDLDKMEAVFADAIKINPKNASLRVQHAQRLLKNEKEPEALAEIQKAIEVDPKAADGNIALAEYYRSKKEYAKAETTLRKALLIDSTRVMIYRSLARLHWIQRDFTKATATLREGLKALDRHVESQDAQKRVINARVWRARLNYWLADYLLDERAMLKDTPLRQAELLKEAKKSHALLIRTLPDDPLQWKIAGKIAYAEKNWEVARQHFERSVQKGVQDLSMAVAMMNVYQNLKLPGKSERVVTTILRSNAQTMKEPFFLLRAARYRMDARDYRAALDLIDRALSADSKNEEALCLRRAVQLATSGETVLVVPASKEEQAMMWRRANDLLLDEDFEKAEKMFLLLQKAQPGDLLVLERLVNLYLRTGRKPLAATLLAAASKANPDNKQLQNITELIQADPERYVTLQKKFAQQIDDKLVRYLRLWQICRAAGEPKEAAEHLAKAITEFPKEPRVLGIRLSQLVADKKWQEAETLLKDFKDPLQQNLARGELAMRQKQWPKAIGIYIDLLQEKPHWKDVRYYLGMCYRASGDTTKAREEFSKVIADDSRYIPALKELAKIAYAANRFDEYDQYLRHIRRYPQGRKDPEVIEMWLVRGPEISDRPKAISERERIFQKNPKNAQNAWRLAKLYEQEKDWVKAQAKYEHLFSIAPDPIALVDVLSNFYRRADMINKAHDLFSKLLTRSKSDPIKAEVYIAYGRFLTASDPKAARAMYSKVREIQPKNARVLRGYSNFVASQAMQAANKGDSEAAKALWDESVNLLREVVANDAEVNDSRVLYRRMIDAGQLNDARSGYRDLLNTNPKDLDAMLGLGQVFLRSGEMDNALKQFAAVIKSNPAYPMAYLFRSEVYRGQGDMEKAAEDIAKAVGIQPQNLGYRLDLAHLYYLMGKNSKALEELVMARQQNPSVERVYDQLLNVHMALKEYRRVESVAAAAIKQFPNSPKYPLAMVQLCQIEGNPAKALTYLREALRDSPDNVSILRRYLKALIDSKDFASFKAQAKAYFDRRVDVPGIKALAALAMAKQGNKEAARPRFIEVLGEVAGTDDVFAVFAWMQMAFGKEYLLQKAPELIAAVDTWRMHLLLGDLLSSSKDFIKAEASYRKALSRSKAAPERLQVRLRLSMVLESQRKYTDLEKLYLTILQQRPNDIMVLNNLAYLYSERMSNPAKALPLAQKAMRLRPGDMNLLDTYAWTLAKSGKYAQALPYLQQVIRRSKTTPTILYHMGFVLEKTGDKLQARSYYLRANDMLKDELTDPLRKIVQEGLSRVGGSDPK